MLVCLLVLQGIAVRRGGTDFETLIFLFLVQLKCDALQNCEKRGIDRVFPLGELTHSQIVNHDCLCISIEGM